MAYVIGHDGLRIGAVGVFVVVVVVAVALHQGGPVPAIVVSDVSKAELDPMPDRPVFVLAVGSDSRTGESPGRADALHLIGVNPALRSATVLNIPRDTWVPVPGHGVAKVNAALALGGPDLQAATVTGLTGVEIDVVAMVDFPRFRRLVDELGGVDVDVPVAMADSASGAFFEPGPAHLDGDQALAVARNRHLPGGDLTRTHHQALLLVAGLAKLHELGDGYGDTLRAVAAILRNVRLHGVSVREVYALSRLARAIRPTAVRTVTMPGTLGHEGAQSVVHVQPAAADLFADFRDNAVLDQH